MKPYLVKLKDHYFIAKNCDGVEERICMDNESYLAFTREDTARKFAKKRGIELEEQVVDRSYSERGFIH